MRDRIDLGRLQAHPDSRGTLGYANIRDNLAGLQGAIARRQAGMGLEKFEQREVKILMQGFARRNTFIVPGNAALDAGGCDGDFQGLENRLAGRPGMGGDGVHGGVVGGLELGR